VSYPFHTVGFLGHKVGPNAGPDISFTCEHSLFGPASGPTLCPTYSVNQTIVSMQPPGIQILLIYARTNVLYRRNYGVDEEDKALSLTKC
jgi:hypothetical protein